MAASCPLHMELDKRRVLSLIDADVVWSRTHQHCPRCEKNFLSLLHTRYKDLD